MWLKTLFFYRRSKSNVRFLLATLLLAWSSFGRAQSSSPNFNIPTYAVTTNYLQYTNFYLQFADTGASSGTVTIENTLPGLTYLILTNSDLNSTNWGIWQTLVATNYTTVAPPVSAGLQQLFFRGQIVLTNAPYITNGMVAYWKLNDGSGSTAADFSGNGYTLNLSNSPAWGSNYLTLNGSTQFGNAGTNPAEFSFQDMSVCAWVYQTSSAYKVIVDKSYANTNDSGGWGFWIQDDGTLAYWGGFGGGHLLSDSGGATVIPGQWVFVTVVWQETGHVATFYINGMRDSSPSDSSLFDTFTAGNANLQVGNLGSNIYLPAGDYAFNGSMRDVAIYNNALTADEVALNYFTSGFPATLAVPDLLYYKMTEFNPADPTHYPFDLADSSTHGGTTGTYGGIISTIWTNNPANLPNTALHFSGVGALIETSNSALFNFTTNSFTINLWLNPYSGDGYVMGNNTYLTNGWFMSVDNFARIYFGSENPGSETALNTPSPIPNWPTTLYSMVTVTRDGTNTPLVYINGKETAMTGSFANPASSTNTLKFGVGTNGVDSHGINPLDGNIWLPQIWSYPLPAAAIANLYSVQQAGRPWP